MDCAFRLTPSMTRSAMVVEVWRGSQMLGTLYPTQSGFRIVTKHAILAAPAEDDAGRGAAVIEISIKPRSKAE